jgi:Tol biopolymer transport system component
MDRAVACSRCAIALITGVLLAAARAETPNIAGVLDSLRSVHPLTEVSISPDGKRLVFGDVLTGKRGGADVDISALWIVDARDGSGMTRLTACPARVCDEHGAAWSPDGAQVAFVTTDDKEQPQIAVAAADGRNVKTITSAHGPLDTPHWSPDGRRIAFLYSEGAPKTPGPLNPLTRDAGVLSSTVYEQRLAIVSASGGDVTLLGPADLNVYEYDWSPDGRKFAVTAAHGSGDDNWWIAELDLLDVKSGSATNLLKPSLQIASPRWSGDGTRIAYIGGLMSDEGITGGDVYVISASGGNPVNWFNTYLMGTSP